MTHHRGLKDKLLCPMQIFVFWIRPFSGWYLCSLFPGLCRKSPHATNSQSLTMSSPINAQTWILHYTPSLSKYDQRAQCKPKHVCVLPSPTSLPMHISCPACTHPMYHLPWQSTAPDQTRPLLQRGVGRWWGVLQMLLNPAAACWQCHGMPLD